MIKISKQMVLNHILDDIGYKAVNWQAMCNFCTLPIQINQQSLTQHLIKYKEYITVEDFEIAITQLQGFYLVNVLCNFKDKEYFNEGHFYLGLNNFWSGFASSWEEKKRRFAQFISEFKGSGFTYLGDTL